MEATNQANKANSSDKYWDHIRAKWLKNATKVVKKNNFSKKMSNIVIIFVTFNPLLLQRIFSQLTDNKNTLFFYIHF